MARFDAVLLDLFETLVTEFDPCWQPKPTPAERLGVSGEVFAEVWRARHRDRMTRALDYREVLREVCSAGGQRIDPGIEAIIEQLHVERLAVKARPLTTVDAEILRILDQLRGAGLELGLISNCAAEEVAAWSESPLAGRFDTVAFSCRVGWAKPDQAIFRRACRELGVATR